MQQDRPTPRRVLKPMHEHVRDKTCGNRGARGRQRGFSLLEIMVVVAIAGILSAVALPAYRDQMTRSRRADAKTTLQQVALWMERNQAATYRYDRDPAGTLVDSNYLTQLGLSQTPSSGTAYYKLSFGSAPTASAYVVIATPQGGQATADGSCGILAIDQIGQRGQWSGSKITVNSTTDACWQR